MLINRVVAISTVLLIAGCAAKKYDYVPTAGENTATLRIGDNIPFVYLTENDNCPKSMLDQSKGETVIPAGKRLWIEPGYSSLGLPGGKECVVPMSFEATAGKHYVLLFQDVGRQCAANVVKRDEDGKLSKVTSLRHENFHRCMY